MRLSVSFRLVFTLLRIGLLVLLGFSGSTPSTLAVAAPAAPRAEAPSVPRSGADLDAAIQSRLDTLPAGLRARSDAYFEGGYWIQLWEYLVGAGVAGLLLQTRLSARMRDLALRLTRYRALQTAVYWAQYVVVAAALSFPWAFYSEFWREHHYGLATQSFVSWLGDQAVTVMVAVVLGSVLVVPAFGAVRRWPRTWHLWGGALAVLFLAFTILIGPVFIMPLFNRYTPITDPAVTGPVLRLARANGMATDRIYQSDASRQSTRISANVSGFLGTEQITLNDNLLRRCTLPEIEAVTAHELGHYVLGHSAALLLFYGVLLVAGIALIRSSLDRLLRRFGPRWGVSGAGDVAGTPLVVLLLTTYFFLLTPLTNTFTRTLENQADLFGLNASRQPDGFADAILKLAEYRKVHPRPLEEWVFYDHPSGWTRIGTALRWKAAQAPVSDLTLPHSATSSPVPAPQP